MSISVSTVRPGSIIEKKREFDKRVISLTKDFEDLMRPENNGIEKEDISSYLERYNIYDVRKVDAIFEALDEDMDGIITKFSFYFILRNEYIKKSLEIEDGMLVKINQQIATINTFKTQYEDAVKKLAEAKEEEKTNSYGIMDDSTLRVTIAEASGLIQAASFFVAVTVGKESKYTKGLLKTLKPFWDEELML